MPVVSQTVLKSYFETGDTPTEAQYVDLIDTFFFHNQAALTAAANAVAVAEAADTRAAACMVKHEDGALFATDATFNVASIIQIDSNRLRVTFTTLIPFPYVIFVQPQRTGGLGIYCKVLVTETDHCEFRFYDSNGSILGGGSTMPGYSLIIYEVPTP